MLVTQVDNSSVDIKKAARFSVAPMMDWTDRHCRYFHRRFSKNTLLYTEMVASAALVKGKAFHLLDFSDEEHPLALQLGGSDPAQLSEAASIGEAHGYDEINLNVGCPSDRVQSGDFGAVLMKNPKLVAKCCKAMKNNTSVDVTVKCRIGVDDQDPYQILPEFLNYMYDAGITRIIIHARKAILKGLSPKENREVPPLDYNLVFKMKEQFPELHLSLNGGVKNLRVTEQLLSNGIDGVMIGRSAYQQPTELLSNVDKIIFQEEEYKSQFDIAYEMRDYLKDHCDNGGKAHQVTRHMTGLFHGLPGAKVWRQYLSGASHSNNLDFFDEALAAVNTSLSISAA